MRYEEATNLLITAENLPAIKKYLLEEDYYNKAVVNNLTIKIFEDIPYLYCPFEHYKNPQKHAALLDSTFVKLPDLIPEWQGYFNLIVIFMLKKETYTIEKYLPYMSVVAHELLHLKQLVSRFNENPNSIDYARNHCLSASKENNIRESMAYELEKIFKFEHEAHAQDWDLGVRYVLSADGKYYNATRFEEKEKYLHHSLSYYIAAILMAYVKKFPKQGEDIKKWSTEIINQKGRNLFAGNYEPFMKFTSTMIEQYLLGKNLAYTNRINF
jgi:hypothetical protein